MRAAIALLGLALVAIVAGALRSGYAQPGAVDEQAFRERAARVTRTFEERGLADPFKGITSDGNIVPDLFSIESTGVSTQPIRQSAEAFLALLSDEQRGRTQFAVDDSEWRKWANMHSYLRNGVSFGEMSDAQSDAAIAMLRESLSADGLELTQDIMRLNTTLAELNNDNFVEYGEDKYYITMMGTPSASEPWGWQLDGHHLVLNYFVLGDQVVLAPAFWGSEPSVATSGRYAGTSILDAERAMGLAMLRSLDAEQREIAVLDTEKTGNNIIAQAFSDNAVMATGGLQGSSLSAEQRRQLMSLIRLWIYKLREDHAAIQIEEIERHLDQTWFSWAGGSEDESIFYYRVQSPVILIEFDHNTPVGLRHLYPPGVPYREHIHAVVRIPNGNDYGKDLLRQHLLSVAH